MKIISFAHTTGALLAGEKTVTRREWNDRYVRSFHAGDLVQAWDRSPRTKQGKAVATIRLTQDPYQEWAAEMPPEDVAREGFAWMRQHGYAVEVDYILQMWAEHNPLLWVVRFELLPSPVSEAAPGARAP